MEEQTKRFDIRDLALTKIVKEEDLYDGEIKVVFNPNARGKQPRYTADSEIIPGVTSVLGVLNKELLKQWAANKASEYWLTTTQGGNPKYVGAIQGTTLTKIYDEARKAYLTFSEKAADLGSLVHYGTECYDEDGTILIFDDSRANEMLARYINWRKETNWEVVSIEKLVYSKEHKYAGTLDRVFKLPDGRLAIMDVKTSKVSAYNQMGVMDEYALQVAAYAIALEEMGMKVACAGFINPDKEFGDLHVYMLDDEQFENGKEAWLATVKLWRLFNLTKYHNKKQNKLTRKAWWAKHNFNSSKG